MTVDNGRRELSACCECGSRPVTYWNDRKEPFCTRCAEAPFPKRITPEEIDATRRAIAEAFDTGEITTLIKVTALAGLYGMVLAHIARGHPYPEALAQAALYDQENTP